jgi:hypothetical protein
VETCGGYAGGCTSCGEVRSGSGGANSLMQEVVDVGEDPMGLVVGVCSLHVLTLY